MARNVWRSRGVTRSQRNAQRTGLCKEDTSARKGPYPLHHLFSYPPFLLAMASAARIVSRGSRLVARSSSLTSSLTSTPSATLRSTLSSSSTFSLGGSRSAYTTFARAAVPPTTYTSSPITLALEKWVFAALVMLLDSNIYVHCVVTLPLPCQASVEVLHRLSLLLKTVRNICTCFFKYFFCIFFFFF